MDEIQRQAKLTGLCLQRLRAALRGGNWNNGVQAGVFALNLNNAPSNSNNNIGLRVAKAMMRTAGIGRITNPLERAESLRRHNPCHIRFIRLAKHMNRPPGAGRETERSRQPKKKMKTYKHLWSRFVNFESLHAAYLKARRGKRFEMSAMKFGANLEQELLDLLDGMNRGKYCTGKYRRFVVREPKRREVAALPFRDRVVQHALVTELEKIYEPRFIHDSYACRAGKGTHAGADRVTEFLRRAHRKWTQTYVLKADIRSYFASVDHRALKGIIGRHVACDRTQVLIDEIINSWNGKTGIGIPIGNLTSQLFANIYLHELDKFVKYQLRWKFYVRYMDDFILLGPDKGELNSIRAQTAEFLREKLKLGLNNKTSIFPEARGVDFLGYRIWKTHRLLRKRSASGMRKKLRVFSERYESGEMSIEKIQACIAAWIGHAEHADTHKLRRKLFNEFELRRKIA